MITWGNTTQYGFTAVSRVFLRSYVDLGLTSSEAMMVLHILDYAWRDNLPFPKVETIAKAMGITTKTVRTYIRSLRAKRLLRTKSRHGRSNTYDFSPLFQRLNDLAGPEIVDLPEWEKEKDPEPKETIKPRVEKSSQADYQKISYSKEEQVPEEQGIGAKRPSALSKLSEVIEASLAVARKREKRRKALPKKVRQALMSKPPENYTSQDILELFSIVWKERWAKAPAPDFAGKDLALAKKLVDHYGPAAVSKVVIKIITEWDRVSREFSLRGYPSMGLIYGFRNSLFPFVLNGDSAASTMTGAQHDEKQSRKNGDEIGWDL